MNVPLTPVRFLERARRLFGGKTGVIDGPQQWTYAQYAGRCVQLAELLRRWELPAESRVAFLSYNTHALLEGYFGVILAGGIFLPLNVRLARHDFLYILNDSESEVLFFHSDFLNEIEAIRADLKTVRRFVLLDDAPPPEWAEAEPYNALIAAQENGWNFDVMQVDERAVAEFFYTSGTTGYPKGVMLTHRNLYLHALGTATALQMKESDIQLHTIPLFHVNGWGTPQFLTCLGGTHVMIEKFEPRRVYELIERQRVTTFSLVPTMAVALVNFDDRPDYDVSSLRLITLGGAAANDELVQQVEETLKCRCLAGYGLTETSPVLTISVPKSSLDFSRRPRQAVQAMTGLPIPGIELEIVDAGDRPLPWDGQSVGEIVVRGDGVMEGYWKLSEETAVQMRGGWFHTGDMATIDPEGYVLIVDRKKDIIISGGENISSLEIEKILLAHQDVLECAVIPIPDPTWGEVPLALVVLKNGCRTLEEVLFEHCRTRLAKFKCPRRIEYRDALPKGGTGKILKRELREPYWAGQPKRIG